MSKHPLTDRLKASFTMSRFALVQDLQDCLAMEMELHARRMEEDRAELLEALIAVVAIADRDTEPFIRARALIAKVKEK